MTTQDIRKTVDALLAAQKTLLGVGEWKPANDGRDFRFVRRVAINGADCGMSLTVKSVPPSVTDEFRFILEYGLNVFRLDYFSYEVHNNQSCGPSDIRVGLVEGPHYHAWSDNRRLCTRLSLAKNMKYARSLPANIRGFDNAFRWFCGETRITLGAGDVPDLPGKQLLI